ncbi:hypothetical protein ANN_19689 [Periplaneta americana]|uniref:Uncharacterized protein n=1 Tax=Periplaneta americana TaxID=6978 RepID=A0ABQ8SAK6_PERAM|nr:hypothetical protein ANN_19689 [Periplaneta americana]
MPAITAGGDHRANYTIPPFWLDDRPPLFRHVGMRSAGGCTESYPAFARIGLRENPGKNLNQATFPDRDSNPGHLVSRQDAQTVVPQIMERTERIRNEAVLERVDVEGIMLKLIRKRKRNWLGHWLRRNYLLKDVLEGMVNVRKVRGRRRYQMIDNIKVITYRLDIRYYNMTFSKYRLLNTNAAMCVLNLLAEATSSDLRRVQRTALAIFVVKKPCAFISTASNPGDNRWLAMIAINKPQLKTHGSYAETKRTYYYFIAAAVATATCTAAAATATCTAAAATTAAAAVATATCTAAATTTAAAAVVTATYTAATTAAAVATAICTAAAAVTIATITAATTAAAVATCTAATTTTVAAAVATAACTAATTAAAAVATATCTAATTTAAAVTATCTTATTTVAAKPSTWPSVSVSLQPGWRQQVVLKVLPGTDLTAVTLQDILMTLIECEKSKAH